MATEPTAGKRGKSAWYILLLIPFVATLWMPFYASPDLPAWNGIPFFYWYMFLWIIISSVLTGVVYYFVK